jgi:hypothetical protein
MQSEEMFTRRPRGRRDVNREMWSKEKFIERLTGRGECYQGDAE